MSISNNGVEIHPVWSQGIVQLATLVWLHGMALGGGANASYIFKLRGTVLHKVSRNAATHFVLRRIGREIMLVFDDKGGGTISRSQMAQVDMRCAQ